MIRLRPGRPGNVLEAGGDASVFPRIPGFFIASAVCMVDERAADMPGGCCCRVIIPPNAESSDS
jgi:hypothetical protein